MPGRAGYASPPHFKFIEHRIADPRVIRHGKKWLNAGVLEPGQLTELKERFRQFDLELHPQKTRILEFGRYAAERREKRGEGKPATFDFLGFTHCCGKSRRGMFRVLRLTMAKRLRAKLKQIKFELPHRMHEGLATVGEWLASVVRGHHPYYVVPGNHRRLRAFSYRVFLHWWAAMCRRRQKGRISLERMSRIAARWLPRPRIHHPYPAERRCV